MHWRVLFVLLILIGTIVDAQENVPTGKVREIFVDLTNPLDFERRDETIEIPLDDIEKSLVVKSRQDINVLDEASHIVPTQWILSARRPTLLFQVNLKAKSTRQFSIRNGSQRIFRSSVGGRFAAENRDDFAWENDRVAFRVYGPALEKLGQISSGIDLLCKRTSDAMLDHWYARARGGELIVDPGEGLDSYEVGMSRGCGGIGILENGQLFVSRNFASWKRLANGPIRFTVELKYAAFPVEPSGNILVSETKRISLDAGSNLNRFESEFKLEKGHADSLNLAIGLADHERGETTESQEQGWLSLWEHSNDKSAMIAIGVVMKPSKIDSFVHESRHYLVASKTKPGEPAVYFAGGDWEHGLHTSRQLWNKYLQEFAARLANPVGVKIKTVDGRN